MMHCLVSMIQRSSPRTMSTEYWRIVDHICAGCMGRLLEREHGGKTITHCAVCGQEAEGDHLSLCLCGQRLQTGKHAGFYCERNDQHKPGRFSEIVGKFDPDLCGK